MAEVFRDGGIPAEALDGATPLEHRRAILPRLNSGETRACMNVGVLTEGFDEPSVDCVIVATPTRSQVKYAQAVGRGLRPFPGKDDCLVIDVVGVSDRLTCKRSRGCSACASQPRPSETVIDAIDRQVQQDRVAAARPTQRKAEGPMRSHEVQLLGCGRREGNLRWLRHGRYWLLSIGQGGLLALAPAGERWSVVRLDRDRSSGSPSTSTSPTRTGSPRTMSARAARCASPTPPPAGGTRR